MMVTDFAVARLKGCASMPRPERGVAAWKSGDGDGAVHCRLIRLCCKLLFSEEQSLGFRY
jgi:hypothetical protein